MSARRLDRLLVGKRIPLCSVGVLSLFVKADNQISGEFCTWFLPTLRYHNPALQVNVGRTEDEEKVVLLKGDRRTYEIPLSRVVCSHELMHQINQIDRESTDKESTEKESTEKESTEKESTEKESTEKESTEKESTETESIEKESTEKEWTDNQ